MLELFPIAVEWAQVAKDGIPVPDNIVLIEITLLYACNLRGAFFCRRICIFGRILDQRLIFTKTHGKSQILNCGVLTAATHVHFYDTLMVNYRGTIPADRRIRQGASSRSRLLTNRTDSNL